MNAHDKAEALRLLDEANMMVFLQNADGYATLSKALRSLLSAQGEGADQNVEAVRTKLLDRSRRGIATYGTTTEREDLGLRDWLVHMQEELLDAAVYIQAAMRKEAEPSAVGMLPDDLLRLIGAYGAAATYQSDVYRLHHYEQLILGIKSYVEQRARELARQGVGNG